MLGCSTKLVLREASGASRKAGRKIRSRVVAAVVPNQQLLVSLLMSEQKVHLHRKSITDMLLMGLSVGRAMEQVPSILTRKRLKALLDLLVQLLVSAEDSVRNGRESFSSTVR